MSFGQLVIGPPGAGKTTYCNGMQQYLGLLGRKTAVVNLDPANDVLPYECAVDVRELVSLEEVQEETGLGPNGGAHRLVGRRHAARIAPTGPAARRQHTLRHGALLQRQSRALLHTRSIVTLC